MMSGIRHCCGSTVDHPLLAAVLFPHHRGWCAAGCRSRHAIPAYRSREAQQPELRHDQQHADGVGGLVEAVELRGIARRAEPARALASRCGLDGHAPLGTSHGGGEPAPLVDSVLGRT